MKIAICDDEQLDINKLRLGIEATGRTHEIHEFLSAETLLNRIYKGEHFDVLFLDIQMPDYDGWEIAKEIKSSRYKIFIVMVTILGDYIFDCFDRVDWFSPKPISQERIRDILNFAQNQLFPPVITFPVKGLPTNFTSADILFLEIKRNTLFLHTTNGVYDARMTLKKAKELLNKHPQFVQCHNSFIVNLDHYKEAVSGAIRLKSGDEIMLSRTYRNSFLSALSEYIQRV